jgi:mono/diheme cytochrome c family protein
MLRPLLMIGALSTVLPLLAAQNKDEHEAGRNKNKENVAREGPSTSRGTNTAYQPVPVAEARRANPVKATPESVASGKKIFGFDCALCHGADGQGKSEISRQTKMPDLTASASLQGRTDGELFYRIKTGHGDMPPEGNRVKPEQLWDLVNYVRSLSEKKSAEEKPKKQ